MFLKWINFRADYILRILTFSAKYNPCEISQNFLTIKFNPPEKSEKTSEKLKTYGKK